MTAPPANAPLLHRLLGIGLVLLAAVFFVLTYSGIAPIMRADNSPPLIAYTLSGLGVVQVRWRFSSSSHVCRSAGWILVVRAEHVREGVRGLGEPETRRGASSFGF